MDVVNTFYRCNRKKRERVQPTGKSYFLYGEIIVNDVLKRL